jgi:hypothetical protein
MKKTLLAIPLCMLFAFNSNAQDDSKSTSSVGFGIKGGYNIANVSTNNDGSYDEKNGISTFHVGAYVDLPVLPILSLQLGATLNGKGAKMSIGNTSSNSFIEAKSNPMYLEVPLNAVFKLPITSTSNVFIGAGPYAAIGLFGKNKLTTSLLGVKTETSENIKYGNDDPANGNNGGLASGDLKRFDFGANIMAGVQIQRITLGANYGLGLANVVPGNNNTNNDKFQHRVLSFSVGYMF